jgi:hypothetical protein
MTQAAESLGWFVAARASRRLLALWCANQRLRPVQAPRTAVGFGAGADRPPLDAPDSMGTLGSAAGSMFLVVQRPSLAVVRNGSAPGKRRCDRRGALAVWLHRAPLVRGGITGHCSGQPTAAAEFRR